jgi:YebC/PmpR family DNA-binding regulatory protein
MGRASVVRAGTKARTDAQKQKNYQIFAVRIIMAVKAGGPDPSINRNLAHIIENAKAANVPKEIITRNIEKASNVNGDDYKEALYEFYGHGGVGLIVVALTDNEKRLVHEINTIVRKNGLKPAMKNSVAFQFDRKERIDISSFTNEDKMLEYCLEAGVEDFLFYNDVDGTPTHPSDEGDSVLYLDLHDLNKIRDTLHQNDLEIETSTAFLPGEYLKVSAEQLEANLAAIAAFEGLDEVEKVHHNIDLLDSPPSEE